MSSFKQKNDDEVKDVLRLLDEYSNKGFIDNKAKNMLYNRIKSIIDHDEWYLEKNRKEVRDKAKMVKFFTQKQKSSFDVSNIRHHEDDVFTWEDGCPDGMSLNDWEDYLNRQDD